MVRQACGRAAAASPTAHPGYRGSAMIAPPPPHVRAHRRSMSLRISAVILSRWRLWELREESNCGASMRNRRPGMRMRRCMSALPRSYSGSSNPMTSMA